MMSRNSYDLRLRRANNGNAARSIHGLMEPPPPLDAGAAVVVAGTAGAVAVPNAGVNLISALPRKLLPLFEPQ